MIKNVVKANGETEPFDAGKLNRWASYGAKMGVEWTTVVLQAVRRLPEATSSKDIQQTLIDICVEKEQIEYSRMAARLELAKIRKTQERNGFSDRYLFKDIYDQLNFLEVWEGLPEFQEHWNVWYKNLYPIKLEHWQIKQWVDKYGLKYGGDVIETPHIGALGIGLAHFGDDIKAFELARAILKGKLNLPTPALNGGRNGDFDSVSCCITSGGDSVESIGVSEHIAYRMTAKKAGIGIEFQTRSKGSPVKGGRVKHLGKHGIFSTVDKAVKMFSQVTRGGSATVSFTAIDPEVMSMLFWKTQRIDVEQRLDKLDYSLVYNDAFIEAVIKDEDWYLFDIGLYPAIHEAFYHATAEEYQDLVAKITALEPTTPKVKARDLLKRFLTARQETGRVYSFNASRANTHTPFKDTVYLSNLCQEICLPTKPYEGMEDLYTGKWITETSDGFNTKPYPVYQSKGETAFCSLAAINVGRIEYKGEHMEIAELALRFVDSMIEKAPAMTPTMEESIRRRRSVGVGITGLAQGLYRAGLDYDGSPESLEYVSKIAETHYYALLKASQTMVQDGTCKPVTGITDWLPIDTMLRSKEGLQYDWEALRGVSRGHSVLTAHMPTESSALFSNACNGLYPPRQRITYKQSRLGVVQFIIDQPEFLTAWEIDNITLSKYYSAVQDFTDQGISCDYYVVPEDYPNGKVPISVLMKEFIAQAKLGLKSQYYVNTKPNKAISVKDAVEAKEEAEDCESCKL